VKFGGAYFFRAVGNCLYPAVKSNSFLKAVPVSASAAVGVGDLVIVEQAGRKLCHRVMEARTLANRIQFLIRADNSPTPDGWFDSDAIYAKVVAIDGVPVSELNRQFRFWWQGRVAVYRWRAHRRLFESATGRWLGRVRSRFTSEPIFWRWYWRRPGRDRLTGP
jgi:hypothetical protein